MKKLVFFVLFLGLLTANIFSLYGNSTDILLSINKTKISVDEFTFAYHHYCDKHQQKVSVDKFLQRYILMLLKVEEAKKLGLDQHPEVLRYSLERRNALISNKYLCQLKLPIDTAVIDSFYVQEIYRPLSSTLPISAVNREEKLINAIHDSIINAPNISFQKWVDKYSSYKQPRWVAPCFLPEDYQERLVQLHVGELSEPFFSSEGLHLVKIIKKKIDDFNRTPKVLIPYFKERYSFQLYRRELPLNLSSLSANDSLFEINSKLYRGRDLKHFFGQSTDTILSLERYQNYIASQLFETYLNELETTTDLNYEVMLFRNEMLALDVESHFVDIPAVINQDALMHYFIYHREDYKYATPKFKGIVVYCSTQEVADDVDKLLKDTPQEEWKKLLDEHYPVQGATLKYHLQLFDEGDNAYVDHIFYEKSEPTLSEHFPYVQVYGKRVDFPENYNEVLYEVRQDYKKFLTSYWIKELRRRNKVEINKEVLKTVNNQ